MACKFYKDGDNWIYSNIEGFEKTAVAGSYRREIVGDKIGIFGNDNDWPLFRSKGYPGSDYIVVTEIEKNISGEYYADVTEFKGATDTFFVKAPASGGEIFTYSLEEQETNKIWLDGEPIYRRTFIVPESPVADSVVSIPMGLTVGDFFKILDGGVQRSATFSSDFVPLPFVDQRDGYNIQVGSTPAKDTIVVNNGLLSEHVGGWITIEYTKA